MLILFFLRRAWSTTSSANASFRAVLVIEASTASSHAVVEPVFRNPFAAALVALFLGLAATETFGASGRLGDQ